MSRKTSDDPKAAPHPDDWGDRSFERTGFCAYRLALPNSLITFDLNRLRRERHELIGELTVRCQFAGAQTVDGILSAGDFNLSSVQARVTRAKLLANRAQTKDVDFEGYLEELCYKTLAAERTGEPPQVLRDVEIIPGHHGEFDLIGFGIPKRHPSILFGDGGAAKSTLALYMGCELAHRGEMVMFCDWEADDQDHKARLDLLYPTNPPAILYVRCERPLVVEADRLRALVREYGITFGFMDSAAYGCAGAPESAEASLDYFRALRSLTIGTLITAHVTKSEDGDKRPFGSSFWHNSARATWHIKRSNPNDDRDTIYTLVTQRKCNFGRVRPAMSLGITFGRTIDIRRASVLAAEEFAPSLTLPQRIMATLNSKPLSGDVLRAEFPDSKPDTLRKTIDRMLERGTLVRFQHIDGQEVIGIKHREES